MQNIPPKIIHKRKINTKNNEFNTILTLQKQLHKTTLNTTTQSYYRNKTLTSHTNCKNAIFHDKTSQQNHYNNIINTKTPLHTHTHTHTHERTTLPITPYPTTITQPIQEHIIFSTPLSLTLTLTHSTIPVYLPDKLPTQTHSIQPQQKNKKNKN